MSQQANNLISIGKILKPSTYCAPHSHPDWEIVLYTHGTGTTQVGNTTTEFKPGTIICMPPGLLQEERSPSGYKNFHLLIRRFEPWEVVPIVHTTPDHANFRIAELLYETYIVARNNPGPLLDHLFGAFIQYLYEWRTGSPHDDLITQLQKTIIERLHEPDFRIAPLFNTLPMSLDHARRLFIKKTGQTPIQFLMSVRMIHAKELLSQGKSAKESAISVGLPDQAYFSRLFSKTYKMGPAAFARTRVALRPR